MINLTLKEKHLINDAFKYANKDLTDFDLGHLEFLNEIEEDLLKMNILLSRTQIDVIAYYLNDLLQITQYDCNEVIVLQQKLNVISDLP